MTRRALAGQLHELGRPLALLVFLFLLLPARSRADIFKNGESAIPGAPGKTLKWRAGYQKSPGAGTSVHFWYDMSLKNPLPGDDVRLVVCAMINVNKPKVLMDAYHANVAAGQWTCTPSGQVSWYPNYHFGCKRIHLHAGNNWHDNISFDATVNLSVAFTDADLMAPYLDLAIDCPGGFVGCDAVFNHTDKFLTPGDGVGPTGTSSWWVVTGGCCPSGPLQSGVAGWSTGNWYSMGFNQLTFPAMLLGQLRDAPGGAVVQFDFPPSTGAGSQQFVVPGQGCVGDPLVVQIPFQITPLLGEDDPNEHTFLRWSFTQRECSALPQGQVMEFLGQVVARDYVYFPSGAVMYAPGDFMYGIHVQEGSDGDAPYLVSQALTQNAASGLYELAVRATDATSMAIGATVRYTVGTQVVELPMPYDAPSADGDITNFRVTFPPGTVPPPTLEVMLVDDAGNTSTVPISTNAPPGMERGLLLLPNRPNPFNSSTALSYSLPAATPVTLKVFDMRGRLVRSLMESDQDAGPHSALWDGKDDEGSTVPEGTYLVRLVAGGDPRSIKVIRSR
jgi:hypothetical protein